MESIEHFITVLLLNILIGYFVIKWIKSVIADIFNSKEQKENIAVIQTRCVYPVYLIENEIIECSHEYGYIRILGLNEYSVINPTIIEASYSNTLEQSGYNRDLVNAAKTYLLDRSVYLGNLN